MPVYQYEGQHYDLPDGLSNEQAIAKIQAHLGTTTTAERSVAQQAPGAMELMFGAGSPIARTIKGAVVDPALAVNQILAQVFPESVKKAATQNVVNVEQAVQQGRERIGSTGFDPYQLLGNVISPTNKLVGFTQAPLTAGGLFSSGGTGAALSALQPVVAPPEEFGGKKTRTNGNRFCFRATNSRWG